MRGIKYFFKKAIPNSLFPFGTQSTNLNFSEASFAKFHPKNKLWRGLALILITCSLTVFYAQSLQWSQGGVINLGGTDYELTSTDNATGGNADFIDSDGAIASGIDPDFDGEPYVQITTGDAGNVHHAYDFGFRVPVSCTNPTVAAFAIQPSCTNEVAQSNGYLQLSSVTNGDRYHWSTGSTFDDNSGANTYANATDLTGATYPVQFNTTLSNADVGDFTIRVYNGVDDCFTDVVVTSFFVNKRTCKHDANLYFFAIKHTFGECLNPS